MARRSDHTRAELTELAVQTGLQLIEQKGFSNFSARGVAASMGYTVGTIYHVFGTVDELILQINARTLDALHEAMQGALLKGKRKPVHALARAQLDFSRTHVNRWSALYEHRLAPRSAVPDWYFTKMERLFTLVEEALLPITGKNRKRVQRAAKILWAGIHGLCVLGLAGKLEVVGAESVDLLVAELVDNILAGLAR